MKNDFKREVSSYSARRGRFDVVDVPRLQFLMIDGAGDPNTDPAYATAVAALYSAAYRIKFFSKKDLGRDYVVMPLEATWWADDMAAFTAERDKSAWRWTLMNMVPDWIAPDHLDAGPVRLESHAEGLAVQTLHVGSYDDEGPVLADLHDTFIPEHGLEMTARHHEIYLNDPRRTSPDKLKTILRQPVRRTAPGGDGQDTGR